VRIRLYTDMFSLYIMLRVLLCTVAIPASNRTLGAAVMRQGIVVREQGKGHGEIVDEFITGTFIILLVGLEFRFFSVIIFYST